MYQHLQSIAAFVAVAETGAFNRAADRLGVKPSVVSHHISKLEDYLGATLIYRTTRKLSLSEHGRILFEASRTWMDHTGNALEQIMDAQNEAIGALNVALPTFLPDPRIEAAILNFIKIHPNVSIALNYSDRIADMLDDHIDLSIRVGTPSDSSFITRKLSVVSHALVASPDLLVRCGTPETPQQLEEMPFVAMNSFGDSVILERDGEEVEAHFRTSQIFTNSIIGALSAAENGVGFAIMPPALFEDAVAAGKLVKLLPQWSLPTWIVQAIWPDTSRRVTLTRRLVDHIATSLKTT
ncbi:LysR family transcriptional regulator [Ruegeria atlantica]|uniref:LysR family transcriptional regulator n=1 Tax=Ruegeria atlantica TaxID=81569 RepID=UPI00147FEDD5|nr:LysR family transcriptional regulator [Ruegeria atlantica]